MKIEPLIYVSDLRKSIEFYTKALGFKLGKLYPDDKNPTYAPLIIGDYKLMLVLARKTNKKYYPKGLSGSGVQFFIQVKDVNAVYRKVKNKVNII